MQVPLDKDGYYTIVVSRPEDRPANATGDLVDCELDVHIAYYQERPSAARLWIGGRTSPTVVSRVRQRMRVLADRMRDALIAEELIPANTDPRILLVVAELGDRILDLAFRENGPDTRIIELGRTALRAYVREAFAPRTHKPSPQPR